MNENQHIPFKITYTQIAITLLIVLLAFGLRFVLLVDRAAADYLVVPLPGYDQYRYFNNGLSILDGTWPTAPYWFHPLPSYVNALFLAITNRSLMGLRLIWVLLDALTCAAIAGSGWLLTRRIWAGWVAGLLYAVYPVSIFYGTTLLIAPMATGLVAWITFVALWQGERLRWWRTAGLGFLSGLLALCRMNIAPVAAMWLLWLALSKPGWRKLIGHGLVWAVVTAATIAPFTAWNYYITDGAFIPVAQTGPKELYMANNRDAGGLYESSVALENADLDFWSALVRDIEVAPMRFAGLLGRKFALFWGASEPGNNIDYLTAVETSPLLQRLFAWNHVWLVVPGLLGLVALFYRDKRWFLYFGLMIAWMAFSGTVTYGYSRTRYPVVVPLMLMAAYLAAALFIQRERINWPQLARRYALPAIVVAALVVFPIWALAGEAPPLPPKSTLSTVPDTVNALDVEYGELRLHGWRPVEQWPVAERGWAEVGQAYTIELFWSVSEPTDTAYQFYLALVDDGARVAGVDRAIGTVSYPPTPTDTWQPDQIYSEIVSVRMPFDAPLARSGFVLLGVYTQDEAGTITNVAMTAPNQQPNLALQTLAVYDMAYLPEPASDLIAANVMFGEQIRLTGYNISTEAVQLGWEAVADIPVDYVLFVHVEDENGEQIPTNDQPPVPGLNTSNWMPGWPLSSTVSLPELDAGVYQIYVGLYHITTGERLSVDGPDNRLPLGELVIATD